MQISIWEERKVFGSRGQILKGEVVGRHVENNNRDVKPMNVKLVIVSVFIYMILWHYRLHIYALHAGCISYTLFYLLQRPSAGNVLEKIISGYHHVYGGQADEDAVLSKCRNAISCLEKADKEIARDSNSGMSNLIINYFNCFA